MSTTNDQMIAGYDYKEWVRLESLFLKDYENSTRYNKPLVMSLKMRPINLLLIRQD